MGSDGPTGSKWGKTDYERRRGVAMEEGGCMAARMRKKEVGGGVASMATSAGATMRGATEVGGGGFVRRGCGRKKAT
ncbi:putative A-kinase anchor protein SPHKAP-like isoform X1 [Sesbania bispinosa]|nr:putative A-kinase anchor protein SPHKAP-like isoform X1 [Sesbania bispinosa]